MRIKKKLLYSILVIFLFIFISISLFFSYIYLYPINIDNNKLRKLQTLVSIYDKNNKIIETKNSYAKYEEIPKRLIDAFISIEDKRFFEHNGVDYIRILGAAKNNLLYKTKQGGSTITQQLAKNMYLTLDKSYDRKIKEIKLAIALEKEYSKEEILEKYLNMLYFGSGEYGIKNAAKRFFNKSLNKLTIKECALLAGIIKSPTKYNPINNYENSIKRCNLVLELMYGQNRITKSDYLKAKNEPIVIKNNLIYNNMLSNYSNSVYFEASRLLGIDIDDIPYMDIKICTYLDLEAQDALFKCMQNENYNLSSSNKKVGLILDNTTLGVNAIYANFNLDLENYKRSPGSTIKPLAVYAPAINDGSFHLFSKLNNLRQDFNGYSPVNYKNYYSEYETIENCIAHSYNTPACYLLNNISIDKSINYLNKLNIKCENDDKNLALALGGMTKGVTFLDLASAYSTFANNGLYNKARFINKIYDNNNNLLYSAKLENSKVFSIETANLITLALKKCATFGSAEKLKSLNFDIASKTGTVSMIDKNYNQDAYNISYTSKNTSLFWIGDDKLDKNITGGGIPTLMAKDFYLNYYKTAPKAFNISENIGNIELDKYYYSQNKYVIADKNSPQSNKINVVINNKNNNLMIDNSYSNIDLFEPNITSDTDSTYIEFTPNPHLNYSIVKRDLFIQKEIDTITSSSTPYKLNVSKNSQYIIIPYYFDDNNDKIIGLPYKYGNAFSILDIGV